MRLVVVGTGTDVGKTWLSCALLRRWRQHGLRVDVRKPVLSGAGADDDAHLLLVANGEEPTPAALARVAPWRFQAAIAPDEAAKREGVVLKLSDVVAAGHVDGPALIETAGGVMSPVAVDGLVIDAVVAWQAPVLLVAGGYLGTISHTLTALAVLEQRACAVAAVVMMQPHDPSVVAAIGQRCAAPVFAVGRDDRQGAEAVADRLRPMWGAQ